MNRDLIRAHILNCEHHGHRIWCNAIKGPKGENWYEDDECDCSRGKAIAELNSAPPEGGAISVDALRNAMQDHYWDSLEPYRTTVMAHMEGVLRLLTSPEPQSKEDQ